MKKANIVVVLIMIAFAIFVFVDWNGESEETDLVLNSKAGEGTIAVKDGAFGGDVDYCIAGINKVLEKEKLTKIPTKYDHQQDDQVDMYRCDIDESMWIEFYKHKKENNISYISIWRSDKYVDDDTMGNGVSDITKEEEAKTYKYYQALATSIDPRFNVKALLHWKQESYKLDDVKFTRTSFTLDDTGTNEERVVMSFNAYTYDEIPDEFYGFPRIVESD